MQGKIKNNIIYPFSDQIGSKLIYLRLINSIQLMDGSIRHTQLSEKTRAFL